MTKIDWIDSVKGFGIMCVVFAHISNFMNEFFFLFHIPLFFLLSGLLFKRKTRLVYLKSKISHLLVPYAVFLFVVLTAQTILTNESVFESVGRFFYGGRTLYLWTGPFWFITCLFLTQQFFNYISKFSSVFVLLICLFSLCLSYLYSYYFNFPLPWSLDTVLFTLPLFSVGFFCKDFFLQALTSTRMFLVLMAFFLLSIFLVSYSGNFTMDLKSGNYGVPFLSFFLSIFVCFFLFLFFKFSPFFSFFSYFGRASMVIMYLHQMVHFVLRDFFLIESVFVLFSFSVAIPFILYFFMRRVSMLRTYLLGE